MFTRVSATERDEGFTLVELLIVVMIIGILAVIATPVLLTQRASAAKASIASDARNSANAVETYFSANLSYPADEAAVVAIPVVTSSSNAVGGFTNNGETFVLCIEATSGPAQGWSVTYDSAQRGVQDPVNSDCP